MLIKTFKKLLMISTLFPVLFSGGRLTFKVPKSGVKSLGDIFSALEGRKSIDIDEFSFSQSTLEQVFLDFAKLQVDEDGFL